MVRKSSEPILTARKPEGDAKPNKEQNEKSQERKIRFVAAVSNSGAHQAWFLDESTGKGFVKAVGEELKLKGGVVAINSVTSDSISFAGDGDARTVRLGQEL